MNFDEQLPSLKAKFDIWMKQPYTHLRICTEAQECCLDKVKVRNTIKSLPDVLLEGTNHAMHIGQLKDDLLKELGL